MGLIFSGKDCQCCISIKSDYTNTSPINVNTNGPVAHGLGCLLLLLLYYHYYCIELLSNFFLLMLFIWYQTFNTHGHDICTKESKG